ncbi:hypothetical protein ACLOJK_029962 [Asimina triloba]
MSQPSVILATAGYDHTIRFWEAKSGRCYRTLQYPDSQVNRLEITPDKQYLAAAGNPHIRLFEVNSNSPQPVISYDSHTNNVMAVGFQCDGNWMYSGSEDGTVRIWDLRAPGCQREYESRAAVNTVVLHPNQTELISGDQNGNIRVWDLTANSCSCELVPEVDTAVRSLTVMWDGSLVVAANNHGTCYVWRLLRGTQVQDMGNNLFIMKQGKVANMDTPSLDPATHGSSMHRLHLIQLQGCGQCRQEMPSEYTKGIIKPQFAVHFMMASAAYLQVSLLADLTVLSFDCSKNARCTSQSTIVRSKPQNEEVSLTADGMATMLFQGFSTLGDDVRNPSKLVVVLLHRSEVLMVILVYIVLLRNEADWFLVRTPQWLISLDSSKHKGEKPHVEHLGPVSPTSFTNGSLIRTLACISPTIMDESPSLASWQLMTISTRVESQAKLQEDPSSSHGQLGCFSAVGSYTSVKRRKKKNQLRIDWLELAMEEKENKRKKQKKNKSSSTATAAAAADPPFKPSSDVKGLRFGGQFIVKSFTVRRAAPLELLRLLSIPPPPPPPPFRQSHPHNSIPFPSTVAFLPTNFTILAHHAWHTLTLGLGTKKSKVIIFVFESDAMKSSVDRLWPPAIPLGEVNKKLIRGLTACEMARFKFRKGCITFYVFAVRRVGNAAFARTDDLRLILQSVAALKDFLDHTAMLALPSQRSICFSPPVAMAH